MARLQYQPATKPRGFQPVQLSRAGIARMEEEGDRVIRNLEKQRDATNQQRREDLQAMQANAAYEERARERNLRTLEKNQKTEQLSIEAEQKSKQQQADANAKAIEATLTGLVNFSVTLGKQAAERTKKMIEDQTELGARQAEESYHNNPQERVNYKTAESQLPIASARYDYAVSKDFAEGVLSPVDAAKSIVANPARNFYAQQGYDNKMLTLLTSDILSRELKDTTPKYVDERTGKKFSGFEANTNRDLMRQLIGKVSTDLRGPNGLNLNSRPPGYLESSYNTISQLNESYLNSAERGETKRIYDNSKQEGNNLRSLGIKYFQEAFRLDSMNPQVGRTGAWQNVWSAFSAIDANGDFLYDIDDLNALVLTDSGKTILEERFNSQGYQNALAARVNAQREYRRAERTNTKLEAQDFAAKATPQMQEYFENADAQGDLQGAATFEKEFFERFPNQSLPSGYVRAKKAALKENYDAEVASIQARAKTQTLDKEFVDAIENPKLQLEAIKAFKEQESAKYGPKYSVMQKSLVSEAKTLTKFDPTVEGPGSGTTIMVTNALKNEYKYFFKALVDKGVPLDAAADQAYAQLTDYIAKGKTEETNKFYTETGALNKPTFPNIQGTTQALSASSQEQRNELNKLILQNNANVGSIFSMPNAVLSETQIETTINSYYADNGTFKIPVNIQYAAKVAGVNPIAAINAQIQASNEKYGTNRKLITASPAEEAIFDQAPSVQKLFTDYDNRSQARISRGTAHVTGAAGPVRASMSMSSRGNGGQISNNSFNDLDGQDTGTNIELYGPQGFTGKIADHQSATGAYGGRGVPIAFPYELTYNEVIPGGRNKGHKSITTQGSTDRVVKGTAPGGFGHVGSYTYTDENGDQYEIMLAHGDQPFNSFNEGQIIPAGTVLGYQGASGSSNDGAGGGYDHISFHVNSYGNGDPNRIIRQFTDSLINPK